MDICTEIPNSPFLGQNYFDLVGQERGGLTYMSHWVLVLVLFSHVEGLSTADICVYTNICGGDCYHFCFCYCYFQYWCYLNLVPSACQAPTPSLTASALSPSLSFSLSLCLFWSRHLTTFPWLGLHSLRSPDGNWSAVLLLCCREQLGVQACAAMSGLIFATESLFREPLLLFSVS